MVEDEKASEEKVRSLKTQLESQQQEYDDNVPSMVITSSADEIRAGVNSIVDDEGIPAGVQLDGYEYRL